MSANTEVLYSQDRASSLQFDIDPFRYRLVYGDEVLLESGENSFYLKKDRQILSPERIITFERSGQSATATISVKNSDLVLVLEASPAAGHFALTWFVEGDSEALDMGVRFPLPKEQHLYGCGELEVQQWPLNKNGFEIQLPDFATRDPFHNLMSPVWLTDRGLGMIYPMYAEMSYHQNHGGDGTFQLEAKKIRTFEQRLIAERNVAEAFQWITSIVGRPSTLPPKPLFTDPIWTTWVEYKADVTQEKVLQYARSIRESGYPYSVIEIDDRWQEAYGDTEFDPAKFPDPKRMVEELHEMGFKVTLWVMPFVDKTSKLYEVGERNGYFLRTYHQNFMNQESAAVTSQVKWWNGHSALIDFTNPEAADWFIQNLKELQSKYGLDGFKFDAGEGGFLENTANAAGVAPVAYSDHYMKAITEAFDYMEARTGWLAQRQSTFIRQFDKFTRWGLDNGLHSVVTQSLTMSLLGYPFVLPDIIGGCQYGNECDKELFIRWVQANALLPCMQLSIAPWGFDGETDRISKGYVNLHQALGGYIYRSAEEYVEGGELSIVNPLFLAYPEDPSCYGIDDQFLLGRHVLAAPVMQEGQRKRNVYLPEGMWYDPWEKKKYRGKQWIEVDAPIHRLPFFLHQGLLDKEAEGGNDWVQNVQSSIFTIETSIYG